MRPFNWVFPLCGGLWLFLCLFFCDRRIEVKCPINLHAFLETLLLTIIHEWKWETLFSLQGTYYPYQVQNTNMYSVFVGITFRVTTYDQSFLVFSRSIRCVLSCLDLMLAFLFFLRNYRLGAWCHFDISLWRFSSFFHIYFHCWLHQANMAPHYLLHLYILSLYSLYPYLLLIC